MATEHEGTTEIRLIFRGEELVSLNLDEVPTHGWAGALRRLISVSVNGRIADVSARTMENLIQGKLGTPAGAHA